MHGPRLFELALSASHHEPMAAEIRKVLCGVPTYGYETQAFSRTRAMLTLQWNVTQLMGTDCRPVGVIALGQDITDRKDTEQALRNSQALYHSLVENIPQNIFRKDRNGLFTFVNRRFLRNRQLIYGTGSRKTDQDLYLPELARKYQENDLVS